MAQKNHKNNRNRLYHLPKLVFDFGLLWRCISKIRNRPKWGTLLLVYVRHTSMIWDVHHDFDSSAGWYMTGTRRQCYDSNGTKLPTPHRDDMMTIMMILILILILILITMRVICSQCSRMGSEQRRISERVESPFIGRKETDQNRIGLFMGEENNTNNNNNSTVKNKNKKNESSNHNHIVMWSYYYLFKYN